MRWKALEETRLTMPLSGAESNCAMHWSGLKCSQLQQLHAWERCTHGALTRLIRIDYSIDVDGLWTALSASYVMRNNDIRRVPIHTTIHIPK